MGRGQEGRGKSFRSVKKDPMGDISTSPLTSTVVSAANINTLLHTNLLVSSSTWKKSKFDSLSTFIASPSSGGSICPEIPTTTLL